jgi:DNA repair protein RecO (recombination protein O)
MKIISDEGIVLRNQPFGESDNIISLFTKKHGRLSCIAKGAKRSKKRFGVNIQPLSQSSFKLVDKGTNFLLRVESCELICYRENLTNSVESFIKSEYAMELVYRLLPEREENENIYNLLVWYLDNIDSMRSSELVVRAFESRLFALLGYRPNLSQCGKCGSDLFGDYVIFMPDEGRVYCERCLSAISQTEEEGKRTGIRVNSAVVQLFKLLAEGDEIDKIEPLFTDEVKKDLKKILWNFILYIHETPMNSWKMMEL